MAEKTQEIQTDIEDVGTVKISEEVVATIASIATDEVAGVAQIVGAKHSTLMGGGRKAPGKGIKISLDPQEGAVIEMAILVEYGNVLVDVAESIQANVRKAVENMTGIRVKEINVNIEGVIFPEGTKKQPEKRLAEKKSGK